jgi:hypothetical protein
MKQTKNIMAVVAVAAASIAGAQGIKATVNGDRVQFPDMKPTMMNGRVMVPVRGVFEHMDSTVMWDAEAGMVTAQRGNDIIKLPVNSQFATVNGKRVRLDTPATVRSGRTMVPLRFLSEALGAGVDWVASSRTVEITTSMVFTNAANKNYTMMTSAVGTVMPFKLNRALSSNNSEKGDKFTGTLVTANNEGYENLPVGTIFEGHVEIAQPKNGNTPGVLGLAFDRVILPDGQNYPIYGSTIGLDSKSVLNDDGRLIAKNGASNDNLKYIGYGAGAGALVAVATKGNVVTNSLIGAALGLVFGQTQKKSTARDVVLAAGSKSGIRLTRELSFRAKNADGSLK